MRGRASHIVNFGFLLGLVVVTSVTLPDHKKAAGLSETVMKPLETTEHVNMDAKMPVMPQLALVAIPQPSADIQVEASKQETPSQRIKAPPQLKAPSKAKPVPLVPKTEMKKRTITPMAPQRRACCVKHRPDVIPLSQLQDLKSATRVAHITPLKPRTKPLVEASMAASSLTEEAVTKEVTQASLIRCLWNALLKRQNGQPCRRRLA